MQLAKQMGLLTHKPIQQIGQAILIERFDRKITATGMQRLAQESLLSVMQKSGYGVSFTHQEAIEALVKHTSVPWFSVTEYFLRDVLNIALGNRDNHGRNTAIHRYGNHIGLTPLFDFAPMYLDQDAIARSATWRSFETQGLPNYPIILSELCEQYEALTQNLPLIINRLTQFVTRFSQFAEIAPSCGIDPQIMRERSSYIAQVNTLMKETLSVIKQRMK
jgi:serine/threonine-protein kinase HipA